MSARASRRRAAAACSTPNDDRRDRAEAAGHTVPLPYRACRARAPSPLDPGAQAEAGLGRPAKERAGRDAVAAPERLAELAGLAIADVTGDLADRHVRGVQQPRRVLHADRGQLVAERACAELGEYALELTLGRGYLARDVAERELRLGVALLDRQGRLGQQAGPAGGRCGARAAPTSGRCDERVGARRAARCCD